MIENEKIEEFKEKGFKLFPNPTETYYPQYDQSTGTRVTQVIPEVDGVDLLQVEVL